MAGPDIIADQLLDRETKYKDSVRKVRAGCYFSHPGGSAAGGQQNKCGQQAEISKPEDLKIQTERKTYKDDYYPVVSDYQGPLIYMAKDPDEEQGG